MAGDRRKEEGMRGGRTVRRRGGRKHKAQRRGRCGVKGAKGRGKEGTG